MVLSASPMMSTMVDYADRLADAMAEAKISTAELARRVGSSYQAVKKKRLAQPQASPATKTEPPPPAAPPATK